MNRAAFLYDDMDGCRGSLSRVRRRVIRRILHGIGFPHCVCFLYCHHIISEAVKYEKFWNRFLKICITGST